jgi:hypothetical protein
MLRAGIHECTLAQLQPMLRKSLESYLSISAPVALCCERLWNGELSAYIVTADKAIKLTYDVKSLITKEGPMAQVARFWDVSSVVESEINSLLYMSR